MGTPNFMRLRRIFDPYAQQPEPPSPLGQIPTGTAFPAPNIMAPPPNPIMPPTPTIPQEEEDINSIMSRIYQPETGARDRLNSLVGNMPQRPTEISGLRKLGSVLVGMGQGPEAQEKATYAPYYRELADWKEQVNPALQAANLERYGNANERQLAYQTGQTQIAGRRAKVAEDAERRRLTSAEAAIENNKKKTDIAKFKAENPDYEFQDDVKSGNIIMVHPRTGHQIDTGLKHGEMSELELANIRSADSRYRADSSNRLKADIENDPRNWQLKTEFRNGIPFRTIRVNKATGTVYEVPTPTGVKPPPSGQGFTDVPDGGGMVTEPNVPPQGAPQFGSLTGVNTGAPRPGQITEPIVTDRGFSPTQQQASVESKVAEIIARKPAWKRWIRIVDGQPKITEPGLLFGRYQGGRPSEEEHKQMIDAVFGGQGQNNPNMPPTNAAPGGTWRQLPSGARIYVEP